MLNGLDLFSGIGGITLALAPWVRPIAYCERDRYAMSVLLSRMSDGSLPVAPIWDDVRTLKGSDFPMGIGIDIIYGGFPCQDISVAGAGAGISGSRSGLFYEIIRLCKEIRPRFIFLENVPAIRTRGAAVIAKELASLGYDFKWDVVSAAEFGAVHIRKRWFLLAHANGFGLRQEQWTKLASSERSMVANSKGSQRSIALPCPGKIKSEMVGDGDGIPFIVDRNRALGNSVVPIQAREAFKRLSGLK